MSHSRTNNFTYRLIFFFLAGKGGGGKKKRRHVVLLLFSLSKGNPGAAAWTWAHSDSDAGWKQDLRPRSLYLTVLRETPPPPNLSCHGPGPLFKRVTWALLDCELHLGSSQEARHCLWWIACAKTKRLRVCSEEIKAARWLSVSARTFFSFFHLIINCVQRWFLLLPLSCHAPRLQGITESHRTGSRIPHPHPNTTITPVIASKPLHALPLSFPKIYKKKHLLKEHPNTPLSHQEVVLITHKCFPPVWFLLPNERFYIYTVYVWMKPLRLDLTAAYRAAPDHGKSFKNRALKLWTSSMKKK